MSLFGRKKKVQNGDTESVPRISLIVSYREQ